MLGIDIIQTLSLPTQTIKVVLQLTAYSPRPSLNTDCSTSYEGLERRLKLEDGAFDVIR